MFAGTLLALASILCTIARVHSGECWADNPHGLNVGELYEIDSSQCCWYCRRYHGKCGACRLSTVDFSTVKCFCEEESTPTETTAEDSETLPFKFKNGGDCTDRKKVDGEVEWTDDCEKSCKEKGHQLGGQCSLTIHSVFDWKRVCWCKVEEEP